MKQTILAGLVATALGTGAALAHYGMIIPSDPMLGQDEGRSIDLTPSFSHPFELAGMNLAPPVAFSVTHGGGTTDLRDALEATTVMESAGFAPTRTQTRPGACIFAMEPTALNTAPETIAFDGEEKLVELGAVIWVHFKE